MYTYVTGVPLWPIPITSATRLLHRGNQQYIPMSRVCHSGLSKLPRLQGFCIEAVSNRLYTYVTDVPLWPIPKVLPRLQGFCIEAISNIYVCHGCTALA